MATLNISQDDALKGFKAASDLNNVLGGSTLDKSGNPLSNLKDYVLGGSTASSGLPFSFKDAQHTKTDTTGNSTSAPFMTWPNWGSLSTQSPWYETLGMSRTQRYAAFALCLAASFLLLLIVAILYYLFIFIIFRLFSDCL